MEIPRELLPVPGQVPPSITSDAELERFQLCWALTCLVTGREDTIFARELFTSDIATGDLAALPEPDQDPEPPDSAQLRVE